MSAPNGPKAHLCCSFFFLLYPSQHLNTPCRVNHAAETVVVVPGLPPKTHAPPCDLFLLSIHLHTIGNRSDLRCALIQLSLRIFKRSANCVFT